MEIDERIGSHRQLYRYSCIPSAVEIVLKLLGRVDTNYYELQNEWDNREDGSFKDFDERVVEGLTFRLVNNLPFEKLFDTIDQELEKIL
jgi:hypothetical protein